MREDGIYFIFFLMVDDIRWWRKRRQVHMIQWSDKEKKRDMEYIVYPPCRRQ